MIFGLSWTRMRLAEPGAVLRLAALAIGAAAVITMVQAALASRQAPGRIQSRLEELAVLSRQEQTVRTWLAAREAFLGARSGQPAPALDFAALAAQSGGASAYEVQDVSRLPLVTGWEAVRIRVKAENATLASLSPLIETAEAAQPPWRLASLSIEPLSPKPGRGRVAVEFETLSPQAPQDPIP